MNDYTVPTAKSAKEEMFTVYLDSLQSTLLTMIPGVGLLMKNKIIINVKNL